MVDGVALVFMEGKKVMEDLNASEEICKQLFVISMKLAKTHPWYEGFKKELEDMLDKCLTYNKKFVVLSNFLRIKVDMMEQLLKETGETMH